MRLMDYAAPASLLEGRIILVTGAASGIGRAAAKSFAAHAATVVLLDKVIPRLESLYDEIQDAGGPEPAIYPLNLEGASLKDYEDLAETLKREFGRLDGLLHNAALLGGLTPLGQYDLELWTRVMQVNLHAPYLLTRCCLDVLARSTDASVVFTAADVGRRARAYWGAYGISKFAVEGMMQILADELEENSSIRVNTLDPGPVRTAMQVSAYPAANPAQWSEPEAIMPAYLYIMGPDSRDVTGQALNAQD